METEYSIVMLKPDSIEMGVCHDIMAVVLQSGFRIVHQQEVKLSAQQVESVFLRPTEEYINYLTRQTVPIFLVEGTNPHVRLYNLKQQIRRHYGVFGRMENLIHTVDQGNEYHIFLEEFFGYLDPYAYTNSIDQNLVLKYNHICEIEECLDFISTKTRLSKVSISISSNGAKRVREVAHKFSVCDYFVVSVLLADCNMDALVYLQTWQVDDEAVKELEQVTTLADLYSVVNRNDYVCAINNFALTSVEIELYRRYSGGQSTGLDEIIQGFDCCFYLRKAVKGGINGLVCFRPDLTLIETELRMDLCRLFGMRKVGGSAGFTKPGLFSVSRDCLF